MLVASEWRKPSEDGGYDVGILHDLVGVGAHDDPAFTPQC